jgi:hypothetical protein
VNNNRKNMAREIAFVAKVKKKKKEKGFISNERKKKNAGFGWIADSEDARVETIPCMLELGKRYYYYFSFLSISIEKKGRSLVLDHASERKETNGRVQETFDATTTFLRRSTLLHV